MVKRMFFLSRGLSSKKFRSNIPNKPKFTTPAPKIPKVNDNAYRPKSSTVKYLVSKGRIRSGSRFLKTKDNIYHKKFLNCSFDIL